MRLRLRAPAGLLLFIGALWCPVQLTAHGDLHARIDALSAEIRQTPAVANLYYQRAELHRMHEEWPLAEADYDRAEKLDPKLEGVLLGRSRVYLAREQFQHAEAEVEKYLKVHPKHATALAVLAQALFGQKRYLEAAEAWERVIVASPAPDVEPYYQQAQALAAAGSTHTDAALRVLDRGLAKLGPVAVLGLRAVELEVAAKRYDAALERLDRIMPKSGRKETWRELRGDVLLKAGRDAEAKAEYGKALSEIEALPARVRSTKAGAALEERLRSKVKP